MCFRNLKGLTLEQLIESLKSMKTDKLIRFNVLRLFELMRLNQNWRIALYVLLRANKKQYLSASYFLEKCEDLIGLRINKREIEILDSELQKKYMWIFEDDEPN